LIQKVAKNQVIRKASLPHWAYPANQAKPGLLYFYPAVDTHFGLYPSVKICLCPAFTLRPPSFCLISPEAFLMTGNGKEKSIFLKESIK